jgi:hypothetical protein
VKANFGGAPAIVPSPDHAPDLYHYTEINRAGVTQTTEATTLTPVDPAINVALYNHTDMVSADDSLAGTVLPGQPGASAVSDTLQLVLVGWAIDHLQMA